MNTQRSKDHRVQFKVSLFIASFYQPPNQISGALLVSSHIVSHVFLCHWAVWAAVLSAARVPRGQRGL